MRIKIFCFICGLIIFLNISLFVEGNPDPPGSDVPDVNVTAEDYSPSYAEGSLEVEWNSRAQSGVDPDPSDSSTYNADYGEKFLVIRMRIKNTGNNNIQLSPDLFKFTSGGAEYKHVTFLGGFNPFSVKTLNPDRSYSGWVIFEVPYDMTYGRLFVYHDTSFQKNVEVSFLHNSRMTINMADGPSAIPGFEFISLVFAACSIVALVRKRHG